MRQYTHAADETTLNALRHLREPWRGWERTPDGTLRVQATDGVVVRLGVAHAEPEPGFAVRCISAFFETGAVHPVAEVAGFDGGANDVVVFEGESWLTRVVRPLLDDADAALPDAAIVTHGHPGSRPAQADAACRTTDAVLVAGSRGATWLVRLGATPDMLDVTTDAAAARRFVEERGAGKS